MQITGTAHMAADPQTAWDAFHDTGVLQRTIPGVQTFEELGTGRYLVTVSLGVASIKGSYKGEVAFAQEVEPTSFVLTMKAAGGAGTIGADISVELAEGSDAGSDVTWSADAVVGGAIGGVGQRMLGGVAKRMATKFFADIDADIAGARKVPAGAPVEGAEAVAGPAAELGAIAAPEGAGVVSDRDGRDAAGRPALVDAAASAGGGPGAALGSVPVLPAGFALGVVLGAGIALAGVAVGAALGRR
ncbi:hypothetical protein GCM10022261_07750 [Brevibacterium daeguense]|uniref:Carbon monoxide dehydrogenase subunit G n=1 Tax=Brevibacterium daeguense TaxID=909936 RepID=A0ABP8EH04_9MICO|nr:SRPBCC domain-containing protein [Brevibacterium daeguense]